LGGLRRREPLLVGDRGEPPPRRLAPGLVLVARRGEERLEVSGGGAQAPALAVEEREVPVRLDVAGVGAQRALERGGGAARLAAREVLERGADQTGGAVLGPARPARGGRRLRPAHAPAPQRVEPRLAGVARGRLGGHLGRVVGDVGAALGVDPDVELGGGGRAGQRHAQECQGGGTHGAQGRFAASAARWPSSGSSSFSIASWMAAREPGSAATTRPRTTPASARESSAAAPISWYESIRNSSPKPGITRSSTGVSASGVTSRGAIPVPPVRNTAPTSSRITASSSACWIASMSSGTSARPTTGWPASVSSATSRSPPASSARVRVSLTVITTECTWRGAARRFACALEGSSSGRCVLTA